MRIVDNLVGWGFECVWVESGSPVFLDDGAHALWGDERRVGYLNGWKEINSNPDSIRLHFTLSYPTPWYDSCSLDGDLNNPPIGFLSGG